MGTLKRFVKPLSASAQRVKDTLDDHKLTTKQMRWIGVVCAEVEVNVEIDPDLVKRKRDLTRDEVSRGLHVHHVLRLSYDSAELRNAFCEIERYLECHSRTI